jgi:hypothetical protein
MRRAHWLRPNHQSEYPHDCVWFDTETLEERVSPQAVRHVLDFGMAAYRRRLRGDLWSAPRWLRFTTPGEFWDWVFGSSMHSPYCLRRGGNLGAL